MDIPKPEERICSECKNSLSLNLFRLQGNTCRYCEVGIKVPSSLLKSNQRFTKKAENSIINKDQSTLIGNHKNHPAIINKTEEPSKKCRLEENILDDIYQKYIHEINIIIGSHIRWSSELFNADNLFDWISHKQFCIEKFKDLSDEQVDYLKTMFRSLIQNHNLDVTEIKASIRVLLRSEKERCMNLIEFVDTNMKAVNNQEEILKVLHDDLMHEEDELGYPIPLIPFQLDEVFKGLKEHKSPITIITRKLAVRLLAKKLNSNELIFDKNQFEKTVTEQITTLLKNNDNYLNNETINIDLRTGLNYAYINFGISKTNYGIYIDANNNEVINLRNSKAS